MPCRRFRKFRCCCGDDDGNEMRCSYYYHTTTTLKYRGCKCLSSPFRGIRVTRRRCWCDSRPVRKLCAMATAPRAPIYWMAKDPVITRPFRFRAGHPQGNTRDRIISAKDFVFLFFHGALFPPYNTACNRRPDPNPTPTQL